MMIKFIIAIVVVTGIGIWFLTKNQNPVVVPDANTFSKIEALETAYDLGEMKVADVKYKDFTIKNSGINPLQITSLSSSCNCTFGQIIYKGQTSREYGMHAPGKFVSEIAVGDSAVIRVTYKPYIMPVYGLVDREVYVETNDPQNSKLIFRVTANIK